jgi:hypothetical protein
LHVTPADGQVHVDAGRCLRQGDCRGRGRRCRGGLHRSHERRAVQNEGMRAGELAFPFGMEGLHAGHCRREGLKEGGGGRFTEGFDTADLQEAKALLEEL